MDLLHENAPSGKNAPRATDLRRLSDRLTFGFARGTDEGELSALLAPELGEVSLDRKSFETDLFLDELIEGAFVVVAGGRRYDVSRGSLRRLLVSPPARQEDTLFRQRILAELTADGDFTRHLENAYVELRALRQALCVQDRITGPSQSLRRRIDILLAFKKAASSLLVFEGAKSGLRRLGAFAGVLLGGGEFERLERLLAFDDQRAVLESHLSVGYDGTLRRFEIVRVTEREHPGFGSGPGARFFRRILGFFRGYRFSEDDVMSQLLEQVFAGLEADFVALLRVTLELEFYLACLGFRRAAEAAELGTCLPSFDPRERELVDLFNPWLLGVGTGPVPCQVARTPAHGTVIVTGPNSGGKTRLLQAIAATQLLGQAGCFVPARRAQLVWVEQLFLSLIERPAAEQKEGRLGTELLRIRKVFETSGAESLIVMDELCSGTNPSEGEEIFEMVIELFAELRPQVFISTHFLDFASRLEKKAPDGLDFLQVELVERERPTYQFVPGVATTSLAQTTAARLGVTRDELLRLVEARRERSPAKP